MIDSQTGWFFVHASVKVIPVLGGKVLLGLNPRGIGSYSEAGRTGETYRFARQLSAS